LQRLLSACPATTRFRPAITKVVEAITALQGELI
jgi:hypothetical protein